FILSHSLRDLAKIQNVVVHSPTTYNMVSTLSSPSAFTPDDHFQVFFEILVDSGSEQVDIEALLSNPGFENLLCSAQFEQLLCRFPLQDLSDRSLEVLIRMVTDKTILEDLADEELVPTFVDLLAKRLVKAVGLEMDNISARSCPLSVTGNHISVLTQPAPHANEIPSYSAEIRSALIPTGSGIYPNSAFSSQKTSRCNIHHTAPSSRLLAPSETLPIYSSIAHGNVPIMRPQPIPVKGNYEPDLNATQRSLNSGFRKNAHDGQRHVSRKKGQFGNERGIHQGSTPYLQRAPQCTVNSTLIPSAFVPDTSMIPFSRKPYGSPCSIKGSAISLTEAPHTLMRSQLEFPASLPHGTNSQRHFPVTHVECARVVSPSCNSAIASQYPLRTTRVAQSMRDTLTADTLVMPRGSYLIQPTRPSHTLTAWSASLHDDSSGIYSSSAFNSQRTLQYTTNHVALLSGLLPPKEHSPTCSIRTHDPGNRSQGVPNEDSQQIALHDQGDASVGTGQDNRKCRVHREDTSYLQHVSHFPAKSSLPPYAFVPDHSAIPFSQTSYRSPCSSEGSASLAVCNGSGFAPTYDHKHEEPGQGLVEELLDTKQSHSVINFTETPGPVITAHFEFPGSRSHDSYPPYNYPSNDVDYAQAGPPNRHSHSSTFGSSPDVLHYNAGIAEPGDTNVDSTSLLDSGRSTAVEEPVAEGWDQDCSSDSLFSSDEEDGLPCVGNGHESTYLEYDPNFEDNDTSQHVDEFDDSSNEETELTYGDDGASQHSEELGVLQDDLTHLELLDPEDDVPFFKSKDALDPKFDEHEGPTLVDLEELGSEYDLDDGFGPPVEEEDEPEEDEPEEDEPDYTSDGASQRSEDWGIPPDEQSNHGYESPCEDNDFYENEVDQYEYGIDEGPYHHLALIPQHFPRSLWSLQLPKSPHLNKFAKYGHTSNPFEQYLFDATLHHIISSHIPFVIVLATSEQFLRSTCIMFLQNLQLSRHFVSPLEGTDIVINYREHLLLPTEYSESDSQFGEEEIEVTHNAMDELSGTGPPPIPSNLHFTPSSFQEQPSDSVVRNLGHDGLIYPGVEGPGDEVIRQGSDNNRTDGYNGGESQHQSYGRETNGYLALVPQVFPPLLCSLQSSISKLPDTRMFNFNMNNFFSGICQSSPSFRHPQNVHIKNVTKDRGSNELEGRIERRKNEGLKGGVKTHVPHRYGPHFFFAIPPNDQLSAPCIEHLVDYEENIADLRTYDRNPSRAKRLEILKVSVPSPISLPPRDRAEPPLTNCREVLEEPVEEAVHDTASNQRSKASSSKSGNSPLYPLNSPTRSHLPSRYSFNRYRYPFTAIPYSISISFSAEIRVVQLSHHPIIDSSQIPKDLSCEN
ncbi:hypothetical protein PQX77_002451, partial [Marasmius sp. AFHP31]